MIALQTSVTDTEHSALVYARTAAQGPGVKQDSGSNDVY